MSLYILNIFIIRATSMKDKAEKAKLAGNKAFVNDRYLEAVNHYSEAIRLSPNDPLFYG